MIRVDTSKSMTDDVCRFLHLGMHLTSETFVSFVHGETVYQLTALMEG